MKVDLWIVVAVTTGFIGFLSGYSLPPLIETGMLLGNQTQQKSEPKVDPELQQYYRDLLKPEE